MFIYVVFFQPFGSLFGSLDHLQNNVGKSSSQCSFSSPVRYAIGYLTIGYLVLPKRRNADDEPGLSRLMCQREIPVQHTDSILIWFVIVWSFLGSGIWVFWFFFLLTSYVACSLLIAIMLCAFLPTATNLPFSGYNKHARKQWQATFTIRSLFIFLLNLLCNHDLVSRFKRTRTCIQYIWKS